MIPEMGGSSLRGSRANTTRPGSSIQRCGPCICVGGVCDIKVPLSPVIYLCEGRACDNKVRLTCSLLYGIAGGRVVRYHPVSLSRNIVDVFTLFLNPKCRCISGQGGRIQYRTPINNKKTRNKTCRRILTGK